MSKPLAGVRVLEVAAWTFVPAAGAILADLGAEVIKVERPTGDPQRALKNMLNLPKDGPNPFNEIPNRGKLSITLDLAKPAGREVVLKLAETCDVFLTSYLAETRTKLGIVEPRQAAPRLDRPRRSPAAAAGLLRPAGRQRARRGDLDGVVQARALGRGVDRRCLAVEHGHVGDVARSGGRSVHAWADDHRPQIPR